VRVAFAADEDAPASKVEVAGSPEQDVRPAEEGQAEDEAALAARSAAEPRGTVLCANSATTRHIC
jgi:hypothetical protein